MSANAEAVLTPARLKERWYGGNTFKDWTVSPVGRQMCEHLWDGGSSLFVFKKGFLCVDLALLELAL